MSDYSASTIASGTFGPITLESIRETMAKIDAIDLPVKIVTSSFVFGYLRAKLPKAESPVGFAPPFSGLSGLPIHVDDDEVSRYQANVTYRKGRVEVLDMRPDWIKAAGLFPVKEPPSGERCGERARRCS